MKAVRYNGAGQAPSLEDVARPSPGPGEVIVRIGGAGVCHSDLHLIDEDQGFPAGFTLGHENAGWVEALGDGVSGLSVGEGVAIYGPWGCGRCHACQLSMENYCENSTRGEAGGGLGFDGGMAPYMRVPDARLLVPLGGLDPKLAASLSDAALTPYHAIKRALPKLKGGDTVVVLGIGGLGHMAVQLLQALAPVRIIAGDVNSDKLAQAQELGADHTVNTGNASAAAEEIHAFTEGRGAAMVLDCVGLQATFDLAPRILGVNSVWTVVGLGGGMHEFRFGSLPFGCELSIPYWGTRSELMEVIEMARDGLIHVQISEFALDDAVAVYDKLRAGDIVGRAVLVPSAADG
ncbi:NAD(P)-dependent alcohol dehydrogenase [Salinisphaera sp. SPP-AMP-43]|uniref:NAD(P)-dependent alcohol dehydrogenase n=1 Tax=Salinisphaera sp. SPP-AMP-43 TaxID=3121288 RepID=UPI003C6DD2C9